MGVVIVHTGGERPKASLTNPLDTHRESSLMSQKNKAPST